MFGLHKSCVLAFYDYALRPPEVTGALRPSSERKGDPLMPERVFSAPGELTVVALPEQTAP